MLKVIYFLFGSKIHRNFNYNYNYNEEGEGWLLKGLVGFSFSGGMLAINQSCGLPPNATSIRKGQPNGLAYKQSVQRFVIGSIDYRELRLVGRNRNRPKQALGRTIQNGM
jgi:hypothetical protein